MAPLRERLQPTNSLTTMTPHFSFWHATYPIGSGNQSKDHFNDPQDDKVRERRGRGSNEKSRRCWKGRTLRPSRQAVIRRTSPSASSVHRSASVIVLSRYITYKLSSISQKKLHRCPTAGPLLGEAMKEETEV